MKISRRKFIKYGPILTSGFAVPAWIATQVRNSFPNKLDVNRNESEIKGLVWVSQKDDEEDGIGFGMIELIPARYSVYGGDNVLNHEIFQFVAPEDRKRVSNASWVTGLDIAFWYFYFLDQYFGYSNIGYDLSMMFTQTPNNAYPEEETFFVEVANRSLTDLQTVLDEFGTGLKVFRSPLPFMSNAIVRGLGGEKLVYEITPDGCSYQVPFCEEVVEAKNATI